MTYTARPTDLPVERTRQYIADLKRRARVLTADRHPMSSLDAAWCRREAERLQAQLDQMFDNVT